MAEVEITGWFPNTRPITVRTCPGCREPIGSAEELLATDLPAGVHLYQCPRCGLRSQYAEVAR